MTSDKERRAVAARMREIMRDDPHGWLDVMVEKAVVDVMGEGEKIGETVADLIDRPTCRNEGDEWGFLCSECGEDVSITKEIPCGGAFAPYLPSYCPNCGAEVVYD